MSELTNEQILAAMKDAPKVPTNYAGWLADQRIAHGRAIIAAHEAAKPGWIPIESAPKDMQEIDIWSARMGRVPNCLWNQTTYGRKIGFIYQSDYDCDGPVFELVPEPTHWMPLPTPPDQPTA